MGFDTPISLISSVIAGHVSFVAAIATERHTSGILPCGNHERKERLFPMDPRETT